MSLPFPADSELFSPPWYGIVVLFGFQSYREGRLAKPTLQQDQLAKPTESGTTKAKMVRQGYDNRTDSQRRLQSLRSPNHHQESRAIIHREAQTFDRKPAANAWIVKREAELKAPGGLEHKEDPSLAAVIDRYIGESKNAVLGTKAQVLKSIKNSDLGESKCSQINSRALVAFARELTQTVEPQTCGNYFSHLSNIFTVARPAWGVSSIAAGI
jgi:hypothetical protein